MTGILFLVLAMFCHNPNHKINKGNCPLIHVTASTLDDDDNGDSGHVPPIPPVPPPPPPPNNP